MKNVSFGLSSFIFLLPFFYSLKTTKTFTSWKLALFTLVVSSFLCNYYSENSHFIICDHTVIILLFFSFFKTKYSYTYLYSFFYRDCCHKKRRINSYDCIRCNESFCVYKFYKERGFHWYTLFLYRYFL